MSDNKRELLELAAKAIGGTLSHGHTKRRIGPTWDEWEWIGEPGIVTPATWKPYGGVVIHPLTDDGDAFRLAVKCGLLNLDDVLFYYGGSIDFQDDPYAATRLAIVRNAAEIGRKMT